MVAYEEVDWCIDFCCVRWRLWFGDRADSHIQNP